MTYIRSTAPVVLIYDTAVILESFQNTMHCYTSGETKYYSTSGVAAQEENLLYESQQHLRKVAKNLTHVKMDEGLLALLHDDGE